MSHEKAGGAYPQMEINGSADIKAETARKLGLTVEQLEKVHRCMLERGPHYWKCYDYDYVLAYICKHSKEITI